jgi:superfamily II DNA or RNA helicase
MSLEAYQERVNNNMNDIFHLNPSHILEIKEQKHEILLNLQRCGILFNVQNLKQDKLRILQNKFTIKTKNRINNSFMTARSYHMMKIDNNGPIQYIILPRFGLFDLFLAKGGRKFLKDYNIICPQQIKNHIPKIQPLNNEIITDLQLEDYQTGIVEYIMTNHFNSNLADLGYAGVNLQLDTGFGKTYIAFELIRRLKVPTLWVAHNQTQADDIYNLLDDIFPDITIGCYHSKLKKNGFIMVIVINSLSGSSFKLDTELTPKEFFNKWGFVICDESHKYCSKQFSQIFNKIQSTYMLGLSATPNERKDKFDKIAHWNLGHNIDIMSIIPHLKSLRKKFTGDIYRVLYTGPQDYTRHLIHPKTEMPDHAETINMISNDPYRLKMIIRLLEILIAENRNVFVFSDRLAYLDKIKKAIEIEKLGNSPFNEHPFETYTIVTGGAKPEDMKFASEKAKIIFSTYSFMGTGKSIPRMDSLIMALPRRRMIDQVIGRIFRPGNENIPRIIFDIVDCGLYLKNQWYERHSVYKTQSDKGRMLQIEELEYSYENIE